MTGWLANPWLFVAGILWALAVFAGAAALARTCDAKRAERERQD
jgi:hypothetical protein